MVRLQHPRLVHRSLASRCVELKWALQYWKWADLHWGSEAAVGRYWAGGGGSSSEFLAGALGELGSIFHFCPEGNQWCEGGPDNSTAPNEQKGTPKRFKVALAASFHFSLLNPQLSIFPPCSWHITRGRTDWHLSTSFFFLPLSPLRAAHKR